MMFHKYQDFFLKIAIAIILIYAATANHQIGYYTFVRWSVTAVSIYFVTKYFKEKQNGLVILFSISAILFNPLRPCWFQKETWHLIDWILAISILSTILFDKKIR